jgi:hypothetical protein
VSEELESLKSSRAPVWVALLCTVALFAVVFFLAIGVVELEGERVTRFEQFMRLPPNAMGDTLAGLGATLTLVWVVASVFQQSFELRAQREEFRKMAAKQAEQGVSLNSLSQMANADQQVEIYKTKLANLRALMAQKGPHRGNWYLKEKDRVVTALNQVGGMLIQIDDRAFLQSTSDQLFLRWVLAGFENFNRDSSNLLVNGYETINFPPIREGLIELRTSVFEITHVLSGLSIGLASIHEFETWLLLERSILKVLDEQRLWTDNGWTPSQ